MAEDIHLLLPIGVLGDIKKTSSYDCAMLKNSVDWYALIGMTHVYRSTLVQQLSLVSFILISLYLTGTSYGSLSPVISEYIVKLIVVYKANNGK